MTNNQQASDEDEGIPPSPSPPVDATGGNNHINEQQQQQANDTIDINQFTRQVDDMELKRLVQDEAMQLPDMGLAISGMAGRFPKSDSVNEFEENLRSGNDMINDQDEARFTCGLWGLPPRAGRLNDLTRFDNEFFGYTHEQANYIDFQLRILYEVVYESILDAGVNPANLRGTNTGVFFGLHCNEFESAMADDPGFKSQGYFAQFGIRVAQYFDFRGLTVTFDAACASGFVGFHNAVEAMKNGTIDQAIVCSSNIPIHPTGSFIFLQMQMLSPTGYSRFLDSRADGYVKSEACVSMFLQQKHVVKRNYCSVLATMTSVDGYKKEGITFPSDKSQERLIRATKELAGISTNHVEYLEAHGTGTPAGDPQEARAISSVYLPNSSSSINTIIKHKHPQQNRKQQHQQQQQQQDEPSDDRIIGPLLLGSVKTNMGHSEAASGLCALAKVALMFEHELIYKGLHYQQPNTNIPALVEGKLKFVADNQPLSAKIIPVSCYGFGGSNVHAIVRASDRPTINEGHDDSNCQQDDMEKSQIDSKNVNCSSSARLIVMFGRNEQSLNEFFDRIMDAESYNTKNCLSTDFLALVDSLNHDKIDRLMNYRGYLVVDRENRLELARGIKRCDLELTQDQAKQLAEVAIDASDSKDTKQTVSFGHCLDVGRRTHLQEYKVRKCHFILPGFGCQWHGMASGLEQFAAFWSTIERLANLIEPDLDLVGLLTGDIDPSASMCNTFVSIVAYQIALINLVRDELELKNLDSIVGHSLGEISCAYASRLFDERETLRIAYEMGKTLDDNVHLCQGKMVAVGLSHHKASEMINQLNLPTLRLSCINGTESVTISGKSDEVDTFLTHWKLNDSSKLISDKFALHNNCIMGKDIRNKLRESLERVLFPLTDYDRTKTKWISSISFAPQEDKNTDPETMSHLQQANIDYFIEMICNRVDFLGAINQLDSDSILIEIGPSNIFESQLRLISKSSSDISGINNTRSTRSSKFNYAKTMVKQTPPNDKLKRLLMCLGELYQVGATFNLNHLYHIGQDIFPVRRQTPSLSSLFKWNHKNELFVPRYPIQFSKSSAKCEMPVDIVQDRDKYLTGHCVEGRILFPATGYLLLIWRVFSFTKRKIYDACFQDVENELVPVEFHNVRLMRAIILGNRVAQIYVHLEEATGRFEIKEGGSVVVEGYARTPIDNPNGLLYDDVRDRIRNENLDLTLNSDDIYKQFRVSGYDYGETFRNIQDCSYDGRYCRVKFNGYFVSLTDSILQSIFLAVTQYAPSGGLFLPTRFDYVRFQPEIILKKIYEAKMAFDLSEKALNTQQKREVMTKMMQRAGAFDNIEQAMDNANEQLTTGEDVGQTDKSVADQTANEKQDPQLECIFETFCDPITGIIITDGIEMRGIKATPAPRRSDLNEVLLESYQFVKDIEEPVEDNRLTKYIEVIQPYSRVCDSLALKLTDKLSTLLTDDNNTSRKQQKLDQKVIDAYKRRYLTCLYADFDAKSAMMIEADQAAHQSLDDEKQTSQKQQYDIKKNGQWMLLSILDKLECLMDDVNDNKLNPIDSNKRSSLLAKISNVLHENRLHLMRDLLVSSWTSERYLRPIIETVIENCCFKKMKLRAVEINVDDELMRTPLQTLMSQIEPQLSLDYSIAHPDPGRIKGGVNPTSTSSTNSSGPTVKTHTLKYDESGNVDMTALFNENHLRQMDFICYKDSSCYLNFTEQLWQSKQSDSNLASIIGSINSALRCGGYALVLMRNRLTLAENILVKLGQQETGRLTLSQLDMINLNLQARCDQLIEEAQSASNKMLCLAKKSDVNGCLALLFRCTSRQQTANEKTQTDTKEANQLTHISHGLSDEHSSGELMLRVRHDDLNWLDELKANFHEPKSTPTNDDQDSSLDNKVVDNDGEVEGSAANVGQPTAIIESDTKQSGAESAPVVERVEPKLVWLCAVATKQNPINGLIGMMQALRKELGGSKLRCYYDEYTFSQMDEPISMHLIEQCENFKLALARDQMWNCVDSSGQFGSFRHFTINDFMSHESCLCSNQLEEEVLSISSSSSSEDESQGNQVSNGQQLAVIDVNNQPLGAYVNTATRGDLSSFAWYEVPLKYYEDTLVETQTPLDNRNQLVKVAYAALNFRDIMLATGRLPLDAIPVRLAMADCLLGLEFSGVELDTNKRVAGMIYGRGIATHVQCPNVNSIKLELPDCLSLEDAATIPVVYATAIMALIYRGQIQRGERILIHAGSGGVGQAAIRLAGHHGLEIFTTVGSDEKRAFLLQEFGDYLTDDHIYSSRDCSFEAHILHQTKGQGVDLVLNSLADDKLQASLRCLREGGRFLEIGKYDMSVDTRFELLEFANNKTIHGILLDKLFDADDLSDVFKQQLDLVINTLKQGMMDGWIKPIKHKVFKRNQVEEAVRYMATGKHIGKILIEIDHNLQQTTFDHSCRPAPRLEPLRDIKCVPRFQLSPRKSYIITGGLGGFGLELCKWLVNQGARYLILTSRTGLKTGYQRATLRRLETNSSCKFLVVDEQTADATTSQGAEILCHMAIKMAPSCEIGGIFHLAMVLKDTLVDNMTQDDFKLVCRPKVDTCLHLDAASRKLCPRLDYFVAFSSITSGKGNTGQANYAYANSCIERVCEQRRRHNLHGLAIQWGAIGDVGVAFENLGGNDVIIGGTIPQRMPSCLATLGRLLCSPFAVCLSVLPVNRSADGQGERGNLVDAIMHVLGIKDTSKVSEDSTLGDLGLDSLMAVEIRQYIEREYDMTLNIQEIRSLTIAKIREINDKEKSSGQKAIKQEHELANKAKVKEVASYGKVVDSIKDNNKVKSENNAAGGAASAVAAVASAGAGNKSISSKLNAGDDEDLDGTSLSSKMRNIIDEKLRASGEIEAMFEKNQIATFVPQLILPKHDFCQLNNKGPINCGRINDDDDDDDNEESSGASSAHDSLASVEEESSSISHTSNKRPIFLLAPIHGKFDQLEYICSSIERPCIGLNWTQRLAKVETVQEAVEIYMDLLQHEFNWGDDDDTSSKSEGRVVDLIGYSFGATIAFELMLAIHKQWSLEQNSNKNGYLTDGRRQRSVSTGSSSSSSKLLIPGQLILLDGSPKQIELGSRYLSGLTRKKPLDLSEIIDELLMVYILANTKRKRVDYLALQRQLKSTKLDKKIEFASSKLAQIIGPMQQAPTTASIMANQLNDRLHNSNITTTTTLASNNEQQQQQSGVDCFQTELAFAMEAFCRRYELILNYKALASLPMDCTLIRAEKMYLNAGDNTHESMDDNTAIKSNYNEDLDLSSIVNGKVNLYIMRGDHETFLNINYNTISDIITSIM